VIRVRVEAASPVIRAGLEAVVRSDGRLQLAAEAAHADVVVTDAFDPEALDGQAVVALRDEPAQALRAGAQAALPRDALPEQILAAIHAVAAGLAAALPEDLHRALPAASLASQERLTTREIEVIRLVADGLGNKQIAWQLGISEHTVKFHVASIMTKLNAGSRTEAVAVAMRHGIVSM
jgi:DNA-binding NarL/FixJ family response regulator